MGVLMFGGVLAHVGTITSGKLLLPMISVCAPPPRYDIKACEVSRWVEPVPEGSPFILVLKDLNFEGKTINLGESRGSHCLFFLHPG